MEEVASDGTVTFSLVRDASFHPLCTLTEFPKPICIGNYRYVCIQHYVLKWMLEEYMKTPGLHEDEIYYICKMLEDLRRIKTYTPFLNYYDNWVITQRFEDVSLNYEMCIALSASESEGWRKTLSAHYSNAYWVLLNEVKGLAISLQGKTLICKEDGELPHESFLGSRLVPIIEALRDRYIAYSSIPTLESSKGEFAVYILSLQEYDLALMEKEGFIPVRRHVRSIRVIDEDKTYVSGIEGDHCELLREFRYKTISIFTEAREGIDVDACIFIDVVQGNKGSSFGVVSGHTSELRENKEIRDMVMERISSKVSRYRL